MNAKLPLAVAAALLVLMVPPAHAQREITVDASLGQAETNTVCPVDLPDRPVDLVIPDQTVPQQIIDIPSRTVGFEDGQIFVPGFFLEIGDDRVIDVPERYIPYEGQSATTPGVYRVVGPFPIVTPDVHEEVPGILFCVVLPA